MDAETKQTKENKIKIVINSIGDDYFLVVKEEISLITLAKVSLTKEEYIDLVLGKEIIKSGEIITRQQSYNLGRKRHVRTASILVKDEEANDENWHKIVEAINKEHPGWSLIDKNFNLDNYSYNSKSYKVSLERFSD